MINKTEVFSAVNLISSVFDYLENYQNDIDLLFELKQDEKKYKISDMNNIVEKYSEMMEKFLLCYKSIKTEM